LWIKETEKVMVSKLRPIAPLQEAGAKPFLLFVTQARADFNQLLSSTVNRKPLTTVKLIQTNMLYVSAP